MGLTFPSDFGAWERWERRRHAVRHLKAWVRHRVPPQRTLPLVLTAASDSPTAVAALDVLRGTSIDALVAPILRLGDGGAVVTRGPIPGGIVPDTWVSCELNGALPSSVRSVLSAGSYRSVSLPLREWTLHSRVSFYVAQHGLITPFAPPLPTHSKLLAWNEEEGKYWRSGRRDVDVTVVGSQLLWKARQRPVSTVIEGPVVWLGQMHGTELPRSSMARAAESFCLQHGGIYRPHPAEQGLAIRARHAYWARRGMKFETSARPLPELARPIAAVFSSGLVEGAAQGLPSWGYHPRPPRWVEELWERNSIGRWGGAPTIAPIQHSEPAARIEQILRMTT